MVEPLSSGLSEEEYSGGERIRNREKYRGIVRTEAKKAMKLPVESECLVWCKPIPVLVSEICRDLTWRDIPSERIMRIANSILRELIKPEFKARFTGRSRVTVAAALFYISCVILKLGVTQREIAHIISVTEVTIRNNYCDIAKVLGGMKTIRENFSADPLD